MATIKSVAGYLMPLLLLWLIVLMFKAFFDYCDYYHKNKRK